MPARYADRIITDQEFRQRVRRHAPSSLLPLVATLGAQFAIPGGWRQGRHGAYAPWVLAEVARVSLVYGNEHRQPATERDLHDCCNAYIGVMDPDLRGHNDLDALIKFLLRTSNEQFSHQHGSSSELARAIALLAQAETHPGLEVLTNDWDRELLGCSMVEYVNIAFLLYAVAVSNNGRFDPDSLKQNDYRFVERHLPRDLVARIVYEQFTQTQAEMKQRQKSLDVTGHGGHPDTRRFAFNPLYERPVIANVVNELLVPVPGLLFRKASPLGLYYLGMERWGTAFSRDMGKIFEAYVGLQLQLAEGAEIYPEISYSRGERRSIDWFAVFENVTLLIEVKSTRPTEAMRLGLDKAVDDLRNNLSKAVKQIDNTAQLVRSRHPDFAHIPDDRPMVGLVVTMESFHVINSPIYRALLPPSAESIKFISALELENLVTLERETAGTFMLDFVNNPEKQQHGALDVALHQQQHRPNAVLHDAWARLPFQRALDARSSPTPGSG